MTEEDKYYFKKDGTWWWADELTALYYGDGSDTWVKPKDVTPKKWEGPAVPPKGYSTGLKCCCGTAHHEYNCPWCGRDMGHLEDTHSNWWIGCCGEIKTAD